jgi:hypothetical protein
MKKILFGIGALVVIGAAASSMGGGDKAPTTSSSSSASKVFGSDHTVTYRVTGSARSASLTMQTPSGTSQRDVDLPTSSGLTFTMDGFVYVSAQNATDSGTVTCEILSDGQVIATNTSSGAYAIASCSGSV